MAVCKLYVPHNGHDLDKAKKVQNIVSLEEHMCARISAVFKGINIFDSVVRTTFYLLREDFGHL